MSQFFTPSPKSVIYFSEKAYKTYTLTFSCCFLVSVGLQSKKASCQRCAYLLAKTTVILGEQVKRSKLENTPRGGVDLHEFGTVGFFFPELTAGSGG